MADNDFGRKQTGSLGLFNMHLPSIKMIYYKEFNLNIKIPTFSLIFIVFCCLVIATQLRKYITIIDSLEHLNICFSTNNMTVTTLYDTYSEDLHLAECPLNDNYCYNDSELKLDHLRYGEKSDKSRSLVLRVRQRTINPDITGEALRALNQALDMEEQGKNKMARKLFVHAHKMDPAHADILNSYGEFMEKTVKDVVTADHFYSKALLIEPEHTKALINRERTMPLVEVLDSNIYKDLDKKLQILHLVPKSHPGLRRASKEAYFFHIYHTNAIEGNTLTLSQTRVILETRTAIGGKSLHEQNEVLGTSSAMNYISDSLINRVGDITLKDILDIHQRVLGHVDPVEAGKIRKTQVAVGNYEPPPPRLLDKLMANFIVWLNSEDAYSLHPIEFAAIAHYRLVAVHPFYDGNGRTARCLMNLILMQFGYPPVTIRVEDRLRYYETLEQANDGDIRPFTRFIAECASATLDGFLMSTQENYKTAELDRPFGEDQRIIEAIN